MSCYFCFSCRAVWFQRMQFLIVLEGLRYGTYVAHPRPFPPPHVQLLRVPINHNIMICFVIAHNKKVIFGYLG